MDGAVFAAARRAEADALANHLQVAHGDIVEALVAQLPPPADRPLAVLLHGAPGALAGGLVGTVIPALGRLHLEGRALRVFVTETRPYMEGARLAAWELRQAGIAYQVIPDAAVAWLLDREPVDAVLIGAEWVAANGDTSAVTGSRAVAQLAAGLRADGREPSQVILAGASAAVDPATPDGAAMPTDLRPTRDLLAYLEGVPLAATDALAPACDVIPAGCISALVTERGVVAPPGPGLLEALSLGTPSGAALEEPGA
jgi:methylthioribose-1-phosphate isomerase